MFGTVVAIASSWAAMEELSEGEGFSSQADLAGVR
jgi:hypothetical protein